MKEQKPIKVPETPRSRKNCAEKGCLRSRLKRAVEQQSKSDEQFIIRTKAMESVADGIFIIDAQKPFFPVTYANPAFQDMTGHSNKEIIGKNYFLLYGAEADPRVVEEIRHTIVQGRSFHGEMLNFSKNGDKYWNMLRITPVRDASGAVTHYVGIQTDVTLLRQREQELKVQREDLLHVTRVGMLAEFVSSLAHEISQPLTAILSYAQASQRLLGDREPKVREILQFIVDDDQRASEVIRRLRSLLKKTRPETTPLCIQELIGQTIALIATDLTVRHIVLKTSIALDLPLVCVDRIQIKQVLLNLISNSFEAIEPVKDIREITISAVLQEPGMIRVSVKDSGSGVRTEDLPRLFTHFFTSKVDGLGMGLSISRSIIEAHGGLLEVANNPDRGATSYFTLPVYVEAIIQK
ncbi:MAG: PAS domain-containing protein [Candidatus Omnitrophica bacterium]|nr:PAS domain-containing protein [Candidatus Omnitrophota bacterium]